MLNMKTIHQSKIYNTKTLWFIGAFVATVSSFALLFSIFTLQTQAATETVYSSDFETDTAGWGGSGSITRVPSGTDGIPSAGGNYFALASGSYVGPNTQLGGYSSVWPGDWKTSIDIYFDSTWAEGSGFIYSVASNKPDGTPLRDFILQAGVLNDESTGNVNKFVALADTAGSPTSDPLYHIKAMPADRRAEITEAGWYTVGHSFQNINGRLVVTVTLSDLSDTPIKSWVIDYDWVDDVIPDDVGGNRYGWFTHAVVPGGVAIDNVTRSVSNNEYSIGDGATNPVSVALQENQTITFLDVIDGAVVSPVDITVIGASNGVQIFIPRDTHITADDPNWDGVLRAPIVLPVKSSISPEGKKVVVDLAVKVGSDTPLQFSHPVKLVLPGQAGKNAGFLDEDQVLHVINTQCGDDPATVLVNGINECYVTDGNDLVIWTTHFSTYLAYSTSEGSGITGGLASSGVNTDLYVTLVALLFATSLSFVLTYTYLTLHRSSR